jgi:alpha-galactosidase
MAKPYSEPPAVIVSDSSSQIQSWYQIDSELASVILDCRQGVPSLLYYGARLAAIGEHELASFDRHEAPASPEKEPTIALLPDVTSGFLGNLGLAADTAEGWQIHPRLTSVELTEDGLCLVAHCSTTGLRVTYELALDQTTGVLKLQCAVANTSEARLSLHQCAITQALPQHLERVLGFEGRWGLEFRQHNHSISTGTYLRENRNGRSSHHCPPALMVTTDHCTESTGEIIAFHLGWSGNHQMRVEQLSDGRRYAQLGERFEPLELILEPGQSYQSPSVYCVHSNQGLNACRQRWHAFTRKAFAPVAAMAARPRPVQINTWETRYFDIDESNMIALIEQSARLGIERFVLDDGWFAGRNDDRSSLGDWRVDKDKFPNRLTPLIETCHRHNMTFGLWVEPEMVSPDSELYRAHPDWVLQHKNRESILARHQQVLDLSRVEVFEYLLSAISKLLIENDIAYLKWDMNRDVHQAGTHVGAHAHHRQTRAVYRLMSQVKSAFPNVEIESCASGGGRVDSGVLNYASRFWPSDSNDALDRISIQYGVSSLIPPETMGSHIGPEECHLTGRRHSIAFRGGVAFWGHLGIEMDISSLSEIDQTSLASLIELHKYHRSLLHSGDSLRIDRCDSDSAWGVVTPNGLEGLFALAKLKSDTTVFPAPYRFLGLRADSDYRLSLIWQSDRSRHIKAHQEMIEAATFRGDFLMEAGLTLPIMKPESILIYHLAAVD